MLDYKEISKSKQIKDLVDKASKSMKGTSDLFIAPNGKPYELLIIPAKK